MKVQFLKDTSTAIIPDDFHNEKTLVVFRDGYKLPKIEGAQFIEFEKYKSQYINLKPDRIVMVGTNRIFVPSIRCELVFEYLQTMTGHIDKISIDNSPFVGEPWRLWFHYSLAFGQWLGFNYSYIVETDWQHWFYRDSENSVISAKSIDGNFIDTVSDLERLNTIFEFYEPDSFLTDYYNEVKKAAFEKYSTPKQLTQFMAKHLNKHLQIDFDFDSYRRNKKLVLPDFGVYRFIAEENQRRMDIYNTAISK